MVRARSSSAATGIRNEAGRPLTLGERKSLAKKPDRDLLERLLADPHPDFIRGVLRNPRLTEDDVVRFVARVPSRADGGENFLARVHDFARQSS